MRSIFVLLLWAASAHALTCSEYEANGNPYSLKAWKSDNNKCTSWKEIPQTDCDFEGNHAVLWQRDCAKASPCAVESVCLVKTPAGAKEPCTGWYKDPNATCLSHAGNWEQHWSRVCTDGRLAEDLCSDQGPQSE